MRKGFFLAAAGSLALAACGGGGADSGTGANGTENVITEETGNTADDANAMGGVAGAEAAVATPDFVREASASDLFEIESSRLAQQKAQRADVKEFAGMLVADHTKSTAELKTAAQAANPPVEVPPPALNAEQQANMTALQGASGAEFDRLYLSQQVPAHEKALNLLRGYAAGGDVQSLKDHASKTSGPVATHLERARALSQQQ